MIMSMLDSQRSPGGGPHRPLPSRYMHGTTNHRGPLHDPRYENLQRLALVQIQPPRNPNKPLTPFFITDILNGRVSAETNVGSERQKSARSGGGVPITRPLPVAAQPQKPFIRPWAASTPAPSLDNDDDSREGDDDEDDEDMEIQVDDEVPKSAKSCSPLDALFQMTSKTFDGRDAHAHLLEDGAKKDQLSLFSKSQPPKKRRKSRTAFTNQQIYELEKRFLYQKYLTPADRDEIAQSLGLSNAQVITWFQNRRAKLKRDLEEIKADVVAAKTVLPTDIVSTPLKSPDHASTGQGSPNGPQPYIKDIDDLYAKHGLMQHPSRSPSSVGSPSGPASHFGKPEHDELTRDSDTFQCVHNEEGGKDGRSRSCSPSVEHCPPLSPKMSPMHNENNQSADSPCDLSPTGSPAENIQVDSPQSPDQEKVSVS